MSPPGTSLASSLPSSIQKIGSRIPFWPATIIAGIVPVIGLLFIDSLFVPSDIVEDYVDTYFVLSALIIFFIAAMRFSWARVERLVDYAQDMSHDRTRLQFHSPLRPSWIILAWLGVLGGITALFGFPDTTQGIFGEHIILLAYFFLVSGTFLLVYGYSMLVIYRAGKLKLHLKPFTEDRMLGLKPFGIVSLLLVSVYAVFPIVDTILNTIIFTAGPTGLQVQLQTWRAGDIGLTSGLAIIGIGLFFLPLLSIHRQLVEEKHREQAWINPQYSDVIRRMKESEAADRAVFADELTLIRQIQSDVNRIQEWPFGLGVLTRLLSILVLPPVLAVVGRIMIKAVLNL